MTRKKYKDLTQEEKEYLLNSSYGEIREIAKKLNINENTVYHWRRCVFKEYGKKNSGSQIRTGEFFINPNPPTELTKTLIYNYYSDDVKHKNMSHDEAIRDVMFELGRTKEYVLNVLRERKVTL